MLCPACGAPNGSERNRCVRCETPLPRRKGPASNIRQPAQRAPVSSSWADNISSDPVGPNKPLPAIHPSKPKSTPSSLGTTQQVLRQAQPSRSYSALIRDLDTSPQVPVDHEAKTVVERIELPKTNPRVLVQSRPGASSDTTVPVQNEARAGNGKRSQPEIVSEARAGRAIAIPSAPAAFPTFLSPELEQSGFPVLEQDVEPRKTLVVPTLFRRATAFFIDTFLWLALSLIFAQVLGADPSVLPRSLEPDLWLLALAELSDPRWPWSAALVAVANAVLVGAVGSTPGAFLMGLSVSGSDGTTITMKRALIRGALGLLSLLALGAGFAWMIVDRRFRTLHDVLAQTVVIQRPLKLPDVE